MGKWAVKLKIDSQQYNQICEDILAYRSEWWGTAIYYEQNRNYIAEIPSLREYLYSLGVGRHIHHHAHTVINPGEELPIHVDNYDTYTWSLTFPFRNPLTTVNRFYHYEGKFPFGEVERDFGPYAINWGWTHPDPDNAEYLGEVLVDGPMLLNTRQPHSVTNIGDKQREALAIRMSGTFDPFNPQHIKQECIREVCEGPDRATAI